MRGIFSEINNKRDNNSKSDSLKPLKKKTKKLRPIKVKSTESYYRLLTMMTYVISTTLIN